MLPQNKLRVMTSKWFSEVNYYLINPKGSGACGIHRI